VGRRHAGGAPPSKKKRKRKSDPTEAPVVVALSEEDVLWTICSMDGATVSVAVPEDAPVAELKRAIGVLREVPCFAIELFMKDVEEALADETPLRSLGNVPLFLLLKQASDRLALGSFFKSCGGAGWESNEGWMTEAELGTWHGVTVDAEGRVVELELENNSLVGCIPSDIQQLSALRELRLGNDVFFGMSCLNKLTGPIPAELGRLRALTKLHLQHNNLSGVVPAELGQLGALTELSLEHNNLSGTVPAELGQLRALTELCLEENNLSGTVPAELRQLGALKYLFLQNNQLTGQEAFAAYMEEHYPDCRVTT
jgi:hypothetical protein